MIFLLNYSNLTSWFMIRPTGFPLLSANPKTETSVFKFFIHSMIVRHNLLTYLIFVTNVSIFCVLTCRVSFSCLQFSTEVFTVQDIKNLCVFTINKKVYSRWAMLKNLRKRLARFVDWSPVTQKYVSSVSKHIFSLAFKYRLSSVSKSGNASLYSHKSAFL